MSYLRPTELDDALSALASGGMTIAAGCTDLFPATERKVLPGDVLDITAISALRGISTTPDHIRIGAATTWTDVIRAELAPAFDGLKLAAREVGSVQIQNTGTVAGNLCNASPAADSVPPLMTLDARVELLSTTGVREVALSDFITGPRKTALRPDELLSAVLVPKHSTSGRSHFLKLGARKYLVISIAMTACRIVVEDGLVREAALSIGACSPVAVRLREIEAAMLGRPLSGDEITDGAVAAMLAPIDDVRADAGYRRDGAAELLRRTVRAAAMGERQAA